MKMERLRHFFPNREEKIPMVINDILPAAKGAQKILFEDLCKMLLAKDDEWEGEFNNEDFDRFVGNMIVLLGSTQDSTAQVSDAMEVGRESNPSLIFFKKTAEGYPEIVLRGKLRETLRIGTAAGDKFELVTEDVDLPVRRIESEIILGEIGSVSYKDRISRTWSVSPYAVKSFCQRTFNSYMASFGTPSNS